MALLSGTSCCSYVDDTSSSCPSQSFSEWAGSPPQGPFLTDGDRGATAVGHCPTDAGASSVGPGQGRRGGKTGGREAEEDAEDPFKECS
mmetsp:Transcript_25486/g.54154  ORF Transcript_25486/g.54154 Transcript_25486/m.54154 type:complete len:89 (-) Transcript_25486:119-385(-)